MGHPKDYSKRGMAEPRWGWSGVAEVIRPQGVEPQLILAAGLLPSLKSSLDSIVAELLDLGARYVRYLHQDEFGPTRAEQIAALRQLREQLDALCSQLNGLPEQLRYQLFLQLALNDQFRQLNIKPSGVDLGDESIIELLYEAAVDVHIPVVRPQAAENARLMEALVKAAQKTLSLLCSVDTTTSFNMTMTPDYRDLTTTDTSGTDLSSAICARIMRLSCRCSGTLNSLEQLRGPEKRVSLPWLVWELCEIWCRETGRSVTSNAIRGGTYTSKPQSPAGRFVLAAAEALQPSPTWRAEHKYFAAPVRARVVINGSGDLHRAMHLAMREYVACDPSEKRCGRPKLRKATL